MHNGAGPSRGLSSTSRRQMRTQKTIEGTSPSIEPETKTERLRRLRFELEELEIELEADTAAATSAGHDDDDGFAYEDEDAIPRKDNADKTRPLKRRKRRLVQDVNGELSPLVLLSQLKRLQGDLSVLGLQDGPAESGEAIVSPSQTKQLLYKLQKGTGDEATIAVAEPPKGEKKIRSVQLPSEAGASRIDARLEVLERYIGANEADIEEVGCLSSAFCQRSNLVC